MKQILFTLFVVLATDLFAQRPAATSFAGGTGSETDPYRISTYAELKYFANEVNRGVTFKNKYLSLTDDIYCNHGVLKDDGTLRDDADIYMEAWETIGKENGTNFAGVLDGQGHILSGFYVKDGAFIQNVNNAIFKNLIIKDSFFSCFAMDADYATPVKFYGCINFATTKWGLICKNSKMYNCGNYGNSEYFGLTWDALEMINCYNYGAQYASAGLACYAYRVLNCMNYNDILGNGSFTIGLVQLLSGSGTLAMKNCVNYGVVFPYKGDDSAAIALCLGQYKSERGSADHLYWLETSNRRGYRSSSGMSIGSDIMAMTEDEMKSQEFLDKLNKNAKDLGDGCCQWKFNREGFPILEIIDEDIASMSSIPFEVKSSVPEKTKFYNLQGQEIKNPTKGIFIKIENNSHSKIILN